MAMQTRGMMTFVCALTLSASILLSQTRSGAASASGAVLSPQDSDELMSKARQLYYRSQAGLQDGCDVVPGWAALSAREDVSMLKKVRLRVALDASGDPTVSHGGEVTPSIRGTVSDVEGLIGDSLALVLDFGGFVPEPGSNYQVEDLGGRFRVTASQGAENERLSLNRDLVIEHAHARFRDGTIDVDPSFMQTNEGLLLTELHGTLTEADGPFRASVRFAYQDVGGSQVIQAMTMVAERPGRGTVTLPVRFTNCGPDRNDTQQAPASRETVARASSQPAATPSLPAVFILTTGERVESSHYLFSANSLQVEQDGKQRNIPLSNLNVDATVAANRERGVDLRIPQNKGEIMLSF